MPHHDGPTESNTIASTAAPPPTSFDVIVVGAGPGGATAARELASRGRTVLLLDREAFPRDKPCGGAVSPRTAALLPFDITPVVEHVVTGVVLGVPSTGLVTRDVPWVMAFMTQRSHLDAFLVEQARRAGATFVDQRRVDGVRALRDGTFEVESAGSAGDTQRYTARSLVGADGANGRVVAALGLERPREHGVAIEGSLPMPNGLPIWLRGRMALTVPLLHGGYGWLFPKGDHINIGVGCHEADAPQLRAALDEYTRTFGWEPASLQGVRGHRLPLRHDGMAVTSGRAVLIGDAAGLVDPLLGEGMYGAVASALAAARAIDALLAGRVHDLSSYQREIDEHLGPELHRARLLADILSAWPRPLNWVATHSPGAWELMGSLVSGEATLAGRGVPLGPMFAALEPIAALARRRTQRKARARHLASPRRGT